MVCTLPFSSKCLKSNVPDAVGAAELFEDEEEAPAKKTLPLPAAVAAAAAVPR